MTNQRLYDYEPIRVCFEPSDVLKIIDLCVTQAKVIELLCLFVDAEVK